jgi:2-C-methyl-D-erythritol 4-phosphate cytidylyltransferase
VTSDSSARRADATAAWAIVVAAGDATRFGSLKQYAPLAGQRVVDWSIGAARAACEGVVLVVPADRGEQPEPTVDRVIVGGATRSASVRAGLALVPAYVEIVVVHDAARPLAKPALFHAVIDAVAAGADAAVPAVNVGDTLWARSDGPLDRDSVAAVQTPQAFRAATLRRAHAEAPEASDDASVVDAAGGRVVLVDGDPRNRKITEAFDLDVATLLLAAPVDE